MVTSDRLTEALRRAGEGRYAVERPIGRGGAATVFLARDLRHSRVVAIKVLDPELGVGTDRFNREIEIAARLSHPNILPLLDSGSLEIGDRSVPYYVMPFVTGESLRDRLTRDGTLPLDDALMLLGEIGGALDYAHRAGVIHRDIKPENILLSDGHAVVADFGIARAVDEAAEPITIEGLAIGTPYYMSPEQVVGETNLDGRTDIYALGCVAFEMLSGRQAFAGHSFRTLMTQRLNLPVPRLNESGVKVPHAVEEAVFKAMTAERDQRFATVADFLQAIRGATVASAPRGRGMVAILGAALVILALVAVWWRRSGGSGGGERIASLAVRPLAHADGDSAAMYLSDGIGEGVIDLLRRIPELSLAAPTLVSQLVAREPTLDLVALGRRLAVGAVLTWEMRRRSDSVQVRAELVDVKTGRLLWGQTFGRRMTETQRLQEEIARTVADSLRIGIAAGGPVAFQTRAADPDAYDAYLRGRRLWLKATPLRARGARENGDSLRIYAAQVIEKDPEFAGGYFLLAAYASVSAIRGWGPFAPLMDSALSYARKANQLDPNFADPYGILGLYSFFVVDDWNAAREQLRTAVRLNPDLSFALYFRALLEAEVDGQLDSAIIHLRRAYAIEPQQFYLNSLGDIWMRAGQYDTAVAVLRQAIAMDSLPPGPYTRLIRSLEHLDRYEEAVRVREVAPDTTWSGRYRAGWRKDGKSGYQRVLVEDVERRIAELERTVPPLDTIPPLREHRIALLYAQLGRWKEAMDWVEREYQRRPTRFRTVVADPAFAGLVDDPRFAELKKRENIP